MVSGKGLPPWLGGKALVGYGNNHLDSYLDSLGDTLQHQRSSLMAHIRRR